MHVELIDGPFDGEWILDPNVESVWIRRRDDGLGYVTEHEPGRARYVRGFQGRFLWIAETLGR
jgi:hypothetical protein